MTSSGHFCKKMLRRLSSQWVGVTVDTGNSVALLEDPLEVVRAYAPWVMTTHVKDMGVQESPDGFLLAEVPLGSGFLDLAKIVATVRKARPGIRLNLEMMTRDPLKIPCLTPKYWATYENVPGKHLAAMLRLVRAKASSRPLPTVSGRDVEERIRIAWRISPYARDLHLRQSGLSQGKMCERVHSRGHRFQK